MENIVITIVICVTLVSIVMVISKAVIHNSKFAAQKAEWEHKTFELRYKEMTRLHYKNFESPKGEVDGQSEAAKKTEEVPPT